MYIELFLKNVNADPQSMLSPLADQSFVHCVVTNTRPRSGTCSIQCMEEGVSVNDDEANAAANTDPSQWRGFDRLRNHMNSEQIAAIRGYFSPQVLFISFHVLCPSL